jgi:hypothetical protein
LMLENSKNETFDGWSIKWFKAECNTSYIVRPPCVLHGYIIETLPLSVQKGLAMSELCGPTWVYR